MKSIKSQREKNIQLLRIGLTCGVFILHINGDAGLFELCIQQGEKAILTPIALECLCICAVDTFLIISGYYLADTNIRNPKKVLDLFIQCGLFRLAKQIMIILTQGGGTTMEADYTICDPTELLYYKIFCCISIIPTD